MGFSLLFYKRGSPSFLTLLGFFLPAWQLDMFRLSGARLRWCLYLNPVEILTVDLGMSYPSASHLSYLRPWRDEDLELVPHHPNRHAYQIGKSVETALLQLVVRVEKALDQQEIALGVFLDIDGAFKNTSFDPMCASLARYEVDFTIVR
jgi:hypothetical protein